MNPESTLKQSINYSNEEDEALNARQQRLVLHFDVDSALILADPSGVLSKEQALNRLLANFAWGRVETNQEGKSYWKLISTHFSTTAPVENTVSYFSYVLGQQAEVEAQQNAFDTFCRSSSPGMKLKPEYDRLLKNITLTTAVSAEVESILAKGKNGASNTLGLVGHAGEYLKAPSSKIAGLLSDGIYQILPGFFRMVNQLNKLKRQFSIVFHSFDEAALKNVIAEFNSFCRGEHACYNGKNGTQNVRLDGQKSSRNMQVIEQQLGTMNRYTASHTLSEIPHSSSQSQHENLVLVTGSLKRAKKTRTIEDEFEKELEEDSVIIHKGISAIHAHATTNDSGTVGIVHDKDVWLENGNARAFSKPILVDQQDFETMNIFFYSQGKGNGQQETEDIGSVEIRDAVTGASIPIAKAMEKYVVNLSLLDLIRDQDFFMKSIDICEKNRNDEIYRLENGIAENAPQKVERSGFEILQEQDKADYLRNTVMPLLYLAFQIVDIERPSDPVGFIAQYCLKNQDRVNIPQPTPEYLAANREKYAVLEKLIVTPPEVKPAASEIPANTSPAKAKK